MGLCVFAWSLVSQPAHPLNLGSFPKSPGDDLFGKKRACNFSYYIYIIFIRKYIFSDKTRLTCIKLLWLLVAETD